MPGGAFTVKEYGDRVQHTFAVVKPRRTTVEPCLSSHCTLPSYAAAFPLTEKGLDTVAPSEGVEMKRSDSGSTASSPCFGVALAAVSLPEVPVVPGRPPTTETATMTDAVATTAPAVPHSQERRGRPVRAEMSERPRRGSTSATASSSSSR